MADIKKQYVYDAEDIAIIELIKESNYSHLSWGDNSLMSVKRKLRDFYRLEQLGSCAFCKNEISLRSALNCTIEHILPKSKNLEFMFTPLNLCVICSDCNEIKRAQEVIDEVPDVLTSSKKRKRYPTVSSAFKIIHPHYDDWNTHIVRLGRAYIDKSKKGINTIAICNLNRFFHKFEVGDEYITETELHELMEEYLTCQSPMRKAELLLQIKSALR